MCSIYDNLYSRGQEGGKGRDIKTSPLPHSPLPYGGVSGLGNSLVLLNFRSLPTVPLSLSKGSLSVVALSYTSSPSPICGVRSQEEGNRG